MGKGLLNQIQNFTPGMIVLGIYNRSLEKAKNACISTGSKEFLIAETLDSFQEGFDRKIPVIGTCSCFRIIVRIKSALACD